MKFIRLITLLAACAAACSCAKEASAPDLASYIDPRIGSGFHGHVFVGADVPFGMVNVGPTSIPQTWDWCSGYHESDSTVIGFSHTHLSGTGIGDLFDVTLMPVVGQVTYARGTEDNQESGLWSYADRTKEIAKPGYYSVPLMRYGITAEMTATKRVGLHRYTFPQSDEAAIVVDLQNGGCWDAPTETSLKAEGNSAVSGIRFSKGWAKNQKLFFYAEFSKPFDSVEENGMFHRLSFKTAAGEQVLAKVAISSVSIEGAKANMAAELPGWDFDETAKEAYSAWNDEISKVKVESSDPDVMKIFYTSMYHTMIHPTLMSDCNGDYRGADDQVHNAAHSTYTVMSLWDVYRAQMPLFTIIEPELYADVTNTMLDIFRQQGKLPVWHLWGNETDCMVGNPAIPCVADAVVKSIPGIDREEAFRIMKESSNVDDRGQGDRLKYGYMPCETKGGSLAEDMECAIADGAIANAARALGKAEDVETYTSRSHSYRNYFDPDVMFMRGKHADGSWVEPFNPYYSNHFNSVYVEGNAWQYSWLVPQDLDGLVELYGSKEKTLERLDSLFSASSEVQGENASPDISGLIGQYVQATSRAIM
jgi:alpha-1,2-mannosidase, putative